MNDTWLKIKAWTKGIVAVLLLVYLVLFLFKNTNDIYFWYWFGHAPHVTSAFLAVVSFAAGSVFTVVIWTTLRTMRQVRNVGAGRRLQKLEREVAEQRARAAVLAAPAGVAPVSTVVETE